MSQIYGWLLAILFHYLWLGNGISGVPGSSAADGGVRGWIAGLKRESWSIGGMVCRPILGKQVLNRVFWFSFENDVEDA